MLMKSLEGKVALVTGGSSGIGRAAALAFAREGAKVVIADVLVEGSRETVSMIQRSGGQAVALETDVTRAEQVEAMVKGAVAAYGRLDCAFNNAGVGGARAPTAEHTEEDWDRIIRVNLKGVWLCMKYEIPQMLEQGGGVIVNTASVAGLVGFNGTPAYVASKHGVVGLTKAAALEYAQSGIRVNAVCPGVIHTPMIDRTVSKLPHMAEVYRKMHPMGRLGEPEEIAEAVVWLSSDAASFVTGHAMAVDGGLTVQ
ncbi:MAG: short chain dehydrogenase [Chloroflexi bacterium]|nr:MAG: short chain dehydrogenase [Chloroflexota bacterium]